MEPHDLAREALVQYLQEQDGIAVVVGCATTREAAALVQRVRADVILLSVDGCVEGVGASLTAIRQGRPAVRVLLLSGEESEELAETVVAERVHGLLTKTKPLVEWLAAVQEIAEGGTYFGEEIGSRLVVGPEGLRLGAIG
jgi:DNA-binding NarL/FixJ family response regulator